MANTRTPGPANQAQRPGLVRDGTLGRQVAPRPGPSGGDVASWPLERKLVEAARRTTARLPREMRGQFAVLFRPESIAITGAVLVAWAASHAVGVGEAVDVVLLLVALGTVGWQAFQVGRDIGAFLRIAAGAQSTTDLDRAAVHLAEAIAVVGVTVVVALVFRGARQVGGVARAAAAEQALWGRTVDEWLVLLTKPRAPVLVRERLEVALGYFREHFPNRSGDSVLGWLRGIDLSKPVVRTTLRPGTNLAMYGDSSRPGMFLTKIGTGMDRLGINPQGRNFVRFEVVSDIEALESHAAEIADTWTDAGKVAIRTPGGTTLEGAKKYQAGGGGTQYILDVRRFIQRGALREVSRP